MIVSDSIASDSIATVSPWTAKGGPRRRLSYVCREPIALKKRTALAAAHRVRLRVHDILMALYLICDASGAEFGSTIIKDKGVLYESRTWTTD